MIITLKIEVKDKTEAYLLTNKIALTHKVVEVVSDKQTFKFDKDNKPNKLFKCQKNIQQEINSQHQTSTK